MRAIVIVLATLIFGCFAKNEVQKFAVSNQNFSVSYYETFDKLNKEENFLISPLSVESAFGMVYAGAEGSTAKQLSKGLSLPNNLQQVYGLLKDVLPLFRSNKQVQLNIANRLYIHKKFHVNKEYEKTVSDVFKAKLEKVDFSKQAKIAKEINKWVQKETDNKIKQLVKPNEINRNTPLMVVNTLYLNADWKKKFGISEDKGDFYKSKKEIVEVDIMSIQSKFNYYTSKALKAQFLEMPYKEKDLSMVFVLPKEKDGLKGLEKRFGDIFSKKPFKQQTVDVTLPKFKIETKIDLNKVFQKMGVKEPFGPKANFKGISKDGKLHLSQALQKTYIAVAENGTEAAAATQSSTALWPAPAKIQFIADHPFIFYIKKRSKNADLILFVGKVRNPEF